MDEQTIFSAGDILVTPTRFKVPGQTYAMSGITSVKSVTKRPTIGPLLLAAWGVIMIVANQDANAIALAVAIIIGAAAWLFLGAKSVVALSSASGEVKALVSRDTKLVDDIVEALNEAIIKRG
ncbi:putative QacE [Candidatus Defluviicoccus seviourii]|uniref:QacE n=2 Tax=root TaxID=1 RepID=A0A564WFV1_9PROT|nr:putative QacE [uncultured Defluviicoccus sp.]VUX47345.1 putative QacE [Candidatus Defluviicoccus seviourii]